METLDALASRRSIRQYTDQPVSEEQVIHLLKAAMAAPSAGNEQPWHFVVIRQRMLLEAIADFHPHAKMVKQAPVAILVCGDRRLEKHEGYWVQDCAAATQNLLLAAHALGLGAVWCGVHPRDDREASFRKLLGIPEEVLPFAVIPLGYPAESKADTDRYNSGRVHYDRW